MLKGLALRTGFKPVEIFRKYLWYLLRERKFDHAAVEDVVYLKDALGLTEEQVIDCLLRGSVRRPEFTDGIYYPSHQQWIAPAGFGYQ